MDHIQYSASYSYRNTTDNSVNSAFINASRNLSVGEHAVRATKWVVVNKQLPGNSTVSGSCRTRGGADVARLNDDAQWIILMGFLVSFSFFFLAMVINQSTIVGQTTAESVIEFPKNDIRDVRGVIISRSTTITNPDVVRNDITVISLSRKNAVVNYNSCN